jgi:lysophospholipase L1-like esterase
MFGNLVSSIAVIGLALFGCSSSSGGPSAGSIGGSGGGNSGPSSHQASGGRASSLSSSASLGGSTSSAFLSGLGGVATAAGGQIGVGGRVSVAGSSNGGSYGDGTLHSGGSATSNNSSVVRGGGASNGGNAYGGSSARGSATAGGKALGIGGRAAAGASGAAGNVEGGKTTAGGTAASGGAAAGAKASGGASTGGSTGNGTSPIKIWIAGDSTVQTCKSACPCGWGGEFDALFNDNVTVVNSAVSGRSIQTWLYEDAVSSTMSGDDCKLTSTAYNSRWTAMTNTSTGMKAGDYLLIQFGINDGDSSCPRHVSSTLFKTYLKAMAAAAKAVGAYPVFLTPTNAITCSGSKVAENRGFLSDIKSAGTDDGAAVIDLNQLTIELYTRLGFCPNNEDYSTGALGDFFCQDHTHFEAAGAKQVAALVAQAIKEQGLGLAAYLR